ncbi:thiamine/thiamine pyrophosphate ABC transporter permease ThiP [Loktanella sp. IMCC34160]|uniref:thiamine/thiamine pyrophosphate ABC transporter permease ThiP n=1 Tax=Loktanella sp. IMCC34160 TaxID=2510646 RepID=UPI001F5DA1BF|nr:thiamine/thiamine pyrophosphate ABC transporter permease ThiP [Loktanella sp. IMCC34160]
MRRTGTLYAVLVLAIVLLPVLAVLRAGSVNLTFGAADWAALRFTILQAALSTMFSVVLAIPVARALARRRFVGRGALITLLGAPFILPVVVAVTGLLAVFGRNGLVNSMLDWFGLPIVSIYGLWGVVLAHVFFNLPLAVRLLLQGWALIPAERFRLAASMNLPVWHLLEWPMLRAAVPGAGAVVFLICLTSFAVALTLGGGPGATTLEVAIYQAVRFDFDLGRAAVLAIVQLLVGLTAALAAWRFAINGALGGGLDRVVARWDTAQLRTRVADGFWLCLVGLLLVLPLAMVVLRGLPALGDLPAAVWPAMGRSVLVAFCAAAISVGLGLFIALRGGWPATFAGAAPLAVSGMVLGTGLFLLLFPVVSPATAALPVTALLNALVGLPFALRALGPAIATAEAAHGRLADELGLTGFARMRWLILPRIRPALGFSAGLAAAFSIGDLGVITLFATEAGQTLPLMMYRLMGAYRMEEAAGVAFLLLGLSLGLFWLFDKGGRINAEA